MVSCVRVFAHAGMVLLCQGGESGSSKERLQMSWIKAERFPSSLSIPRAMQSRRYLRQTVSFFPALLPASRLPHSGPAAIQSALANTSNIIFITAQVELKATCTDRCHELYLSFPFYCLVASGKEGEDLVMKCCLSAVNAQEHFAVLPINHRGVIKCLLVGYQCVMEGQDMSLRWISYVSDLIISCKCISAFTLVPFSTCTWANQAATLWTEGPLLKQGSKVISLHLKIMSSAGL